MARFWKRHNFRVKIKSYTCLDLEKKSSCTQIGYKLTYDNFLTPPSPQKERKHPWWESIDLLEAYKLSTHQAPKGAGSFGALETRNFCLRAAAWSLSLLGARQKWWFWLIGTLQLGWRNGALKSRFFHTGDPETCGCEPFLDPDSHYEMITYNKPIRVRSFHFLR